MATAAPQAIALVMNSVANASGEHVEEIIKALKALPQCMKADAEAAKMSATSGVKKSRSKKSQGKTVGKGPKRPLNSWMAYRKFYNLMLSPRTQKIKSKILTVLWQADPFEAKWSILAKSYSILRGDRDKKEVPLDRFLELCAPLIGVIPADIYLEVMGWQLGEPNEQDQAGNPHIRRAFIPKGFPDSVATTTLSVEDLVQQCINAEIFTLTDDNNDDNNDANVQQSGSLTMAVQPWTSSEASAVEEPESTGDLQLPLGMETLRSGITELNDLEFDSDVAAFDPSANIHNTWNPAELNTRYDDGGVWDSFNLSDELITDVLSGGDVDFESFVNAEHIS